MTDAEITAGLNDFQALFLTIWAEARSEPVDGQIAVAWTIRNRVNRPQRFGASYRAVCLARKQFSCWNPGTDANHVRLMELTRLELGDVAERSTLRRDPVLEQVKWIAEGVISGRVMDNTKQAGHYLTTALFHSEQAPRWAKGQTPLVTLGRHVFLKVA